MENIKVHDWFASRFLNPNKDPMALISEGITPNTADIKDRDFYKSKEKVKEAFKTDSGEFDEEKYNKTYDQFFAEYSYLSAIDSENFILNAYEKSSSNFSTDFGKVIEHSIDVNKVGNPLGLSKGVTSINDWSTPILSKREAAQKNQYWDNEKQKWSDKTVNEAGLLGLLTGKPLVYATWDEDGTHIDKMSGEEVKHQKGEWKTDEFGNYYAETVDNEEALDKQFVTWSQVITDDESPWNNIDIFDSDSIEQNIPRTLLKAGVMAAATMLYPPVASTIFYSTAAINLARVLPQISKSVSAFFGVEEFDTLNKWDNAMRKFGRSTSDYAQEHFFSFENIIDMAIDSYMQYGTQKAIALLPSRLGVGKEAEKAIEQTSRVQAFNLFRNEVNPTPELVQAITKSTQAYRNAEKILNKANKISNAVSRAYLVATSVEDVYNQSKLHGFDSQTAGVISLAAYAGVGALFASDYGRGLLYNAGEQEIVQDIHTLTKRYLQNNAEKIKKDVLDAGIDTAAKKSVLKEWGNKISKLFTDHLTDIKSGRYSIVQGGLAEGFEEVAEEISQDTAYQIGKAWQSVKELFTGKEYNNQYNYLETDPLERYGTAFFGGALGGAIFKMSDRFLDPAGKASYENWKKMMGGDNSEIMKQLVLYVSQGKKDLIFKELDKLEQTPLASTTINAFTGEATKNIVDSQNSVLFNTFRKAINDIDTFLSNYNLKIDKERFGDVELLRGVRAAWLVSQAKDGKGLQDSLFEDYQSRLGTIVGLQGQISEKRASIKDNTSEEEKSKINKEISQLQKVIDAKVNEVRTLVDGKDDSYLGRLMLETSKKDILDKIIPTSKDGWAEHLYNTTYDNLPELLQKDVDSQMSKYAESGELQINYMSAWKLYKDITSADDVKTAFQNVSQKFYNVNSLDSLTEEERKIYFVLSNIILGTTKLRPVQADAVALMLLDKNPEIDINWIPPELFGNINKVINEILSENVQSKLSNTLQDPQNEQDLILWNPNDNISFDQYIRYYINQNNVNLEKVKQLLIEVIESDDQESWIYDYTSMNYDNRLLNNVIDTINLKVSDIQIQTFIDNLIQRRRDSEAKFLLEDVEVDTLNEILYNLDLVEAIVTGSDEEYSNRLAGNIPFGANNFLNQAWKDKGVLTNLSIVNTNAAMHIKDAIMQHKEKINDLLNLHRENSNEVVNNQKRIGIKTRELKIKAVQNLYEHGNIDLLNTIKDVCPIPELKNLSKLSDEEYIELDVEYRNWLIKFENTLYDLYHKLDDNLKNQFANQLRTIDKSWYYDTDYINTDIIQKEYFNTPTIYNWLASCTLGNNEAILREYKNIINTSDKYPFDPQEEIIITIAKFALTSHQEELKRFYPAVDPRTGVNSLPELLKIICSGGTGKSNVIIPISIQIIKNLNPNKKIFASANTDKQLETLYRASELITENSSLLIENLLDDLDKEGEANKYRDSVIFIDECTNIDYDELNKLNTKASEYNIKIVLLGDTTQHGNGAIDLTICLFAPQLDESYRALNNIMAHNNKAFVKLLSGNSTEDYNNNFTYMPALQYYDSDRVFFGIKYQDPGKNNFFINIKEFLESHDIPNTASILLFTKDSTLDAELSEKYPNITIEHDIEKVQGHEWDYVFTDSPLLKFDANVYGNVSHPARVHIKDIYTLFSRAKEGVLTFVNPIIEIKERNTPKPKTFTFKVSEYPPVKFGYINNLEVLSAYINFKKSVFDRLNLNGSVQEPSTSIATEPAQVVQISQNESVPVSVGFVLNDDFDAIIDDGQGAQITIADALNITSNQYIELRNLLYLYLVSNKTNNIIKNKIDNILQNSNIKHSDFLISIENHTANNLLVGDNTGELGSFDGTYPWLVYHIELNNGISMNIHMGMFPYTGTQYNTLDKTSTLNEYLEELCKNKLLGLYQIPNDVTFSRSQNALDFRKPTKDVKGTVIIHNNGNTKAIITKPGSNTSFDTLGHISSSLPCFFRSGSGSENIPADQILQTLVEIENIYHDLHDKLVNKAKLNQADLMSLTDILSYTKDQDGNIIFKPRQMPKLLDRFIIFASSIVDSLPTTPFQKLQQMSAQYLNELKELKEHLEKVQQICGTKITTDKINNIQNELKNKILFSVTPVVFTPETIDEKDIENVMQSLCKNLNKDKIIEEGREVHRYSYHRAIGMQFALLVQRLAYLGTLDDKAIDKIVKSEKTSKDFSKEELISLINLWNRHKETIIQAYKTFYTQNNISDEQAILGLQLLLFDKNNKPIMSFEKITSDGKENLFATDAFINLFKEFYTSYNTSAPKLNRLASYFKNWRSSDKRVHGAGAWSGYLHSNIIKNNGVFIDFDSTSIEINGNHEFELRGVILQQSKLQIYSNSNMKKEEIKPYQSVIPQPAAQIRMSVNDIYQKIKDVFTRNQFTQTQIDKAWGYLSTEIKFMNNLTQDLNDDETMNLIQQYLPENIKQEWWPHKYTLPVQVNSEFKSRLQALITSTLGWDDSTFNEIWEVVQNNTQSLEDMDDYSIIKSLSEHPDLADWQELLKDALSQLNPPAQESQNKQFTALDTVKKLGFTEVINLNSKVGRKIKDVLLSIEVKDLEKSTLYSALQKWKEENNNSELLDSVINTASNIC